MEQLSRIEAEQQRLLMIQTGGMPGMMGGMMMMGGPGGPGMMPGAAPGELAAILPSACCMAQEQVISRRDRA